MTTLAEAMAKATATLKAAGIESARIDARVLAAYVLQLPAGAVPPRTLDLSETQAAALDVAVGRRAAEEPVAYITGHREFYGLDFEVGPGVLIPRAETETLVDEALKDFADTSDTIQVLDLGAGSGCLVIAFLLARQQARAVAIDRSPDAIKWCKRNILRHNLQDRCQLFSAGWEHRFDGQFDVVFSNPPYIQSGQIEQLPRTVRSFEPLAALEGGTDGLQAYAALGPVLRRRLTERGKAYLEIGLGQHHMVREIMEASGLKVDRIVPDLAGIPRCVVVSRGG